MDKIQLNVLLPSDLVDRVREAAELEGCWPATIVQRALERYLDTEER